MVRIILYIHYHNNIYKPFLALSFMVRENTTREKINALISENKINPSNFQELSNSLNIPYKTIKWYYYKLREKENTENHTEQIKNNVVIFSRLQINIKQIENDLYLYVKTSKEFEDYLKENKEIIETNNLFGEGKNSKVYRVRFMDRNYLDDINTPIFYCGRVNFGFLRVCGISEGLEFKINGLLPESLIKKGLKELINAFKDFYKREIEKTPINLTGEVETHVIQKEVLEHGN